MTMGGCSPTCVAVESDDGEDDGSDDGEDDGSNSGSGGPSLNEDAFCSGFAVDMYMEGFELKVSSPGQQCLVFLFKKFVLDSGLKYVLACMVTIVLGMFTEFIVSLRRRVTQGKDYGLSTKVIKIFLYAMQIGFGYLATLVAMTYSLLLFFMIVIGLTVGHVLFNFQAKVTEYSEPCCSSDEIQTEGVKKAATAMEVKVDREVGEAAIEA